MRARSRVNLVFTVDALLRGVRGIRGVRGVRVMGVLIGTGVFMFVRAHLVWLFILSVLRKVRDPCGAKLVFRSRDGIFAPR